MFVTYSLCLISGPTQLLLTSFEGIRNLEIFEFYSLIYADFTYYAALKLWESFWQFIPYKREEKKQAKKYQNFFHQSCSIKSQLLIKDSNLKQRQEHCFKVWTAFCAAENDGLIHVEREIAANYPPYPHPPLSFSSFYLSLSLRILYPPT